MKNIFIFILIVTILSGCSVARRSLHGEQDRKDDFREGLTTMEKAYAWQAFIELAPLIDPKSNPEFILRKLGQSYRGMKIHKVQVEEVEFSDEAKKAFVVLRVQTFSKPRLILETHFDQVRWKHSVLGDGWKIDKITVGKAEKELGGFKPSL